MKSNDDDDDKISTSPKNDSNITTNSNIHRNKKSLS